MDERRLRAVIRATLRDCDVASTAQLRQAAAQYFGHPSPDQVWDATQTVLARMRQDGEIFLVHGARYADDRRYALADYMRLHYPLLWAEMSGKTSR